MKYLILGAGPAGLSFANQLMKCGQASFLVLEKEEKAGGLCRSEEVDGTPLDIGGGHFLDVRNEAVCQFLFSYMPKEEWNLFERNSMIAIGDKMIHHPIEANIWQLDMKDQVEYLKSIAFAGCNKETKMPEKFVDWIYWKLGSRIAEDYMIPYNQKMFSKELNQLGTYWLDKLPNVSFEETLMGCLNKKAYGKQPAHARFYYPKKYGYGELWDRMAKKIEKHLKYQADINGIDLETRTVSCVCGLTYTADIIINTIPWQEFETITGMPDKLVKKIDDLKSSSVEIDYRKKQLDTSAQWIYYPDLSLPYHRILVRKNFMSASLGYWTETNGERITEKSEFSYLNRYAYPLNTIDKPQIMSELLSWVKSKNVYGLGRWGEHKHYNSDVVVERAVNMADMLEAECGNKRDIIA